MKTDDLISLMTQDTPVRMRYGRSLGIALIAGIVFSAVVLIAVIGVRKDMAAVIDTARVCFKIGVTAMLAVISVRLAMRIGRPGEATRPPLLLLLLPLLIVAAAVVTELSVLPQATWKTSLMGQNALLCLLLVPILSIAPLTGLFWALRQGAPASPTAAGAAAGLAAGAIAVAIYAWHCPDDSPLFLATWYTIAIAVVTGAGALFGYRWLRW